jgi:hypothetical protein
VRKRSSLCFLLALFVLLPWLVVAQAQPGDPAGVADPLAAVTFDGSGQAAIAAEGTVTLDLWTLVMMVLTPLVPAVMAHFSAFVSSNRPWMKIVDLIAGNYLAARNDQSVQ